MVDDVQLPSPGEGEVLVRVAAAGVGPWDAIIREGRSKVSPQPPLTLGSDLSGFIEAVGAAVIGFRVDNEVYGVTNPQFCGAQAEYAVASAGMIAPKSKRLSHIDAASAAVIAVTAYQMLFEYAGAKQGDTVMITGAAGNVGAYAVQLALQAGVHVVAVARPADDLFLRSLGAQIIVDSRPFWILSVDTPLSDVSVPSNPVASSFRSFPSLCLSGMISSRSSFTPRSLPNGCGHFQTSSKTEVSPHGQVLSSLWRRLVSPTLCSRVRRTNPARLCCRYEWAPGANRFLECEPLMYYGQSGRNQKVFAKFLFAGLPATIYS